MVRHVNLSRNFHCGVEVKPLRGSIGTGFSTMIGVFFFTPGKPSPAGSSSVSAKKPNTLDRQPHLHHLQRKSKKKNTDASW
mmetsp:Transcript_74374/g.131374  ORF Transcript_74374/g.131374 Transcript_74374/m.131374 type:complete len:81 (-) Transcript_74374:1839-2081(-)